MKLLMLAAASSVHVVRWANAFADRGIEVHLVTQHVPDPAIDPHVHIYRIPHFGGLGYLLNWRRVRSLVRQISPDLLNVHYASGYGSLAGAVKGLPIVLNVWGSDVLLFPEKSTVHRSWLIGNLRKAVLIVSSSRVMAQKVKELVNGDIPVHVVPFGVDTELFTPVDRTAEDDTLVLGTVKALAPVYGIDVFLRALALVMNDPVNRKVRALIAGGGLQDKELRALASELRIADKVEFLGAVPHASVPRILHRLDIFCALSRSESFGVSVIEASACGLPVIVSDAGGLPEVVEHGVTGLVVPKEDPFAAAKAMQELISSASLRKRMGGAGRQRVNDLYAWDRAVEKMLTLFRSVVRTA